jgi:ribulose-phosphate 3-epimerase
MKHGSLAPSMMCVQFAQMSETLERFERFGVEYLHIDIMDGEFVPNFALGTDFCAQMRKMTSIPLDIHLMITRPDLKLDCFNIQPGEYVSVHWESTPHIQRVLASIRAKGAKAMVALNPATPICVLEHILDSLDGVLLMTVNPGFAGQAMVPGALEKIRATREYLDAKGYSNIDIEVDGNVSFENAKKMRAAGANIFVGGSSSVFSVKAPMEENLAAMNAIVGRKEEETHE